MKKIEAQLALINAESEKVKDDLRRERQQAEHSTHFESKKGTQSVDPRSSDGFMDPFAKGGEKQGDRFCVLHNPDLTLSGKLKDQRPCF